MSKTYRKGAVGAMMDEYERAALELKQIVESISDSTYAKLRDESTKDENCRSIQTILSHVVSSGYGYADYLRNHFGILSTRPEKRLLSRQEALSQLNAMLNYTIETLENRWEMPEEEIEGTVIQPRWGGNYHMEQLLEHAIVHILRHRRQLDKFLSSESK
jgi:uncharacterized damage-inducible protein DinB